MKANFGSRFLDGDAMVATSEAELLVLKQGKSFAFSS
jgi:hypothetical protein